MLSKNIGKLLKAADNMQLYYYEANKRLNPDDMPTELVGGQCLPMVVNNPRRGLQSLSKRVRPFIRFCESNAKKSSSDGERKRLFGMVGYVKKLQKEVLERVDNRKNNAEGISATQIRLSYFV